MLTSNKIKFLLKTFIISIIIVGIFTIKSSAMVKPTNQFYVNDYANLLSTETKNYIINTNISLNSKTGAQIVVVTVQNLEGRALEEYATALFREFGIGDKNKNNGVLLLLALEERQFRVEVGYGLEGTLTDGKTGRIQDEYIIPYLKQNDWNEGIKNGFSAILKEVEKEYNIDVGSEEAVASPYSEEDEDIGVAFFFMGMPIISGIAGGMLRALKLKKIKRNILIGLSIIIIFIINYFAFGLFTIIPSQIVRIVGAMFCTLFDFAWFVSALLGKIEKRILWWWTWRLLWRRRFFTP